MAYIEQAIIYATRIIFPCSAEYFFMQQEKFFRAAWDFISSYGKQDFQQQKTEFPGTGNLSSCCKKSREAWRRFDEVAGDAQNWRYKRILPSTLHSSPCTCIYKKNS